MKKILTALVIILSANLCFAYDVVYNKATNKFHDTDCHLVNNCTKNCVIVDIDKAIELGASPCEKCRTEYENSRDKRAYQKRQIEEEKFTPGTKKYGNYTYTVK